MTSEVSTRQLYYEDPYLTNVECRLTRLEERGSQQVFFELDRTIYYPEGGGQPADQGVVTTEKGSIKVLQVRWQDGRILHQGVKQGTVAVGQPAVAALRWSARYKNMRVHSAGHLIHDVLMTMQSDLTPIRANHGDKAFLEYRGVVEPSSKDEIEVRVNEIARGDLPIRTWESDHDEIVRMCKFVPPNLPKHKALRVLRIGEYDAMPDGGVQVRSTREIGRVIIHHVLTDGEKSTIRYGVGGPIE